MTGRGVHMRPKESDDRTMIRLCDELLRGRISNAEWLPQINEIKQGRELQEKQEKLLREIDARYGKGRHPFVQGGLPELGKDR